jgi:hypothetical protein
MGGEFAGRPAPLDPAEAGEAVVAIGVDRFHRHRYNRSLPDA